MDRLCIFHQHVGTFISSPRPRPNLRGAPVSSRVCIIPARGGSKRIPRKNIRPFCGIPMIERSIRAAQRAACFERIVVSTDDDEIADLATRAGAECPFVRPASLSDDNATSIAVIQHAAQWLIDHDWTPDYVCCLYATAPFVTPDWLTEAHDILVSSKANFCFPVTSYGFAPQRALRRVDGGGVSMLYPEYEVTRSQDLVEAFHDAGAFYWGSLNAWIGGQSIYSLRSATILLPRHLVQDIDTEEDWTHAEILFHHLSNVKDTA
jgi:pseudaminic acid cytidylyltransferase